MTKESLRVALARARERLRADERIEAAADETLEAEKRRVAVEARLHAMQRQHAEELSRGLEHTAAATTAAMGALKRQEPTGAPPLSACMLAYVRERNDAVKAWNAKTKERWEFTFRLLGEGLGDPPINEIRREHITMFLERLRRMPSNAQKRSGLVGKTFLELTAGDGEGAISDQTVKDHMLRVASFFKWCVQVDSYGLTRSPAASFDVSVAQSSVRRPFTDQHLHALFTHKSWTEGQFQHPHQYWLPLIAVLSGMRLNEVCQLRLVDFAKVGDVELIKCADQSEGQRGKNKNAVRRVPIHSDLERLGLLRWVEQLRSEGQTQLFPELRAGRDGHGQGPSKWFGKYRKDCGIDGRQQYVFHSFRHRFISSRLDDGVADHLVAALVGHETGLITGDTYWNDRDVEKLRRVVNAITLPESVREKIPVVEQVRFIKSNRRPPSRAGIRKSRDQRVADSVARKLKNSIGT